MFTVKWVAENGSEMLYESVGDVSFTPGSVRDATSTTGPNNSCVTFPSADSAVHTYLDTGTIYVMNDKGGTVATYRL